MNPMKQISNIIAAEKFLNLRAETVGTYQYVGWAWPGTPEDEIGWTICRVETITDNTIKIFADGTNSASHKWSDRATLDYSV